MTTIRLAIFEATQMSCEMMSRALEASSHNIQVVSTGVSSEFKDDPRLNGANVAVIGSSLKEGHLSGFTLLRRLSKANRDLNCVLLLDRDERDLVIEAFRSGAVGVCERDKSYEQLCKCIICVRRGQVWANSQQMRYVLEALSSGLPPLVTNARGQILLTKREHEIVSKVAEGMKNREIAELLNVSEHTVKNHLFRIFERLGISSRAELILYLHGQKGSSDSRTGTY
jgi:DNA-binding NarL/FixJ family response regulator